MSWEDFFLFRAGIGQQNREGIFKCLLSSSQPKIEWLKNQMIIGDDPKFRQISNQGICSLEIRKPCSFDGGVYTCRAKNAQGEATVSCKLEVKRTYLQTNKGSFQWMQSKSVEDTKSLLRELFDILGNLLFFFFDEKNPLSCALIMTLKAVA